MECFRGELAGNRMIKRGLDVCIHVLIYLLPSVGYCMFLFFSIQTTTSSAIVINLHFRHNNNNLQTFRVANAPLVHSSYEYRFIAFERARLQWSLLVVTSCQDGGT